MECDKSTIDLSQNGIELGVYNLSHAVVLPTRRLDGQHRHDAFGEGWFPFESKCSIISHNFLSKIKLLSLRGPASHDSRGLDSCGLESFFSQLKSGTNREFLAQRV